MSDLLHRLFASFHLKRIQRFYVVFAGWKQVRLVLEKGYLGTWTGENYWSSAVDLQSPQRKQGSPALIRNLIRA